MPEHVIYKYGGKITLLLQTPPVATGDVFGDVCCHLPVLSINPIYPFQSPTSCWNLHPSQNKALLITSQFWGRFVLPPYLFVHY